MPASSASRSGISKNFLNFFRSFGGSETEVQEGENPSLHLAGLSVSALGVTPDIKRPPPVPTCDRRSSPNDLRAVDHRIGSYSLGAVPLHVRLGTRTASLGNPFCYPPASYKEIRGARLQPYGTLFQTAAGHDGGVGGEGLRGCPGLGGPPPLLSPIAYDSM